MKKTFMPDFKDSRQLSIHQLEGLKWTIDHAYNGSPFYRKRFETAGVSKDYMTIKTELIQGIDPVNNEDIKHRIIKTVQSKILVSCDVSFYAYGELPRFEEISFY